MIITNICGGTGNQLFQYAAGRRLANKNNTELKLYINWFNNVNTDYRPYSLNHFNINQSFVSSDDLANATTFNESTQWFIPEVLHLPDNIILNGYWQSEKYFYDIKEILYQELTLKSPLSDDSISLLESIQSSNSVGIHVRRGDFLRIKDLGICTSEYYKRSIDYILALMDNPLFFIFGKEHNWAKENLDLSMRHCFVDNKNTYEDLFLMSECKHLIIANSTFSWWSAWLNKNPDKIIIRPDPWFNRESSKEVPLKEWIEIPTKGGE